MYSYWAHLFIHKQPEYWSFEMLYEHSQNYDSSFLSLKAITGYQYKPYKQTGYKL